MDVHTVPGGLGDVYTILVMLLKDPNYFYRYYPRRECSEHASLHQTCSIVCGCYTKAVLQCMRKLLVSAPGFLPRSNFHSILPLARVTAVRC